MKKYLFLFLICLPQNFSLNDKGYKLIVLKASTGTGVRFGNCLQIIYSCIYISYKYNIPFVFYGRFQHSNDLAISQEKQILKRHIRKKFKKIIRIGNEKEIKLLDQDTIFEIDNFKNEISEQDQDLIKKVNQEFKRLITPLYNIELPINPAFAKAAAGSPAIHPCNKSLGILATKNTNNINIAVHVRRGGGYDKPRLSKDGIFDKVTYDSDFKPTDAFEMQNKFNDKFMRYIDISYPLKFPPDSFYVAQIKKLVEKLDNNFKIHIHIFTDDPEPKKIVEKYQKALFEIEPYKLKNKANIIFSCREKNNHHDKNIFQDFFALTKFDYLIRADSTFSAYSEILGDFKIIIYPLHGTWVAKDLLVIDKVKEIINFQNK